MRAEGRRPIRDAIHLDAFTGDAGSNQLGSRPDVPPALIAGDASDPASVATRRWSQSVVRTSISELPEVERDVILMAYALDLSQAQIAERLGWPLGTVKSRTRRALAQLRTHLGAIPEEGVVENGSGVLEPDRNTSSSRRYDR
jgi:RNA polymerase sigma factor (sigma-70 family)